MLLRRTNPIMTFITIAAFLVCFGLSLWFVHASSFKNSSADQTPILRSASNNSAATVSYRRNAETHSVQPIITIANYFMITAGNDNLLFAYVDLKAVQSPWLLCGKVSIPTRADPNLLIA